MGVSTIRQPVWRIPGLFSEKSTAENDRAWRRSVACRLRLLLKIGIGLLIIVWLLGVVWVVSVS